MAQGVGVGFEQESINVEKTMSKSLGNTVAKMQATVSMEHSRAIPAGVSSINTANSNSVTNNNDNGITLNIEKFENNTKQDIETLANELAFYITRTQRMR